MTLEELKKILAPLPAAQRKAVLAVDGMTVTDEAGNPVDVQDIQISSTATKTDEPVMEEEVKADEPADEEVKAEGDPEEEPAKGKTVAAPTQASIDKMVKAAIAAQTKKTPPRRPIIVPEIRMTERKYLRPTRYFVGTKGGMSGPERAERFGNYALAVLSKQIPGHYNFKKAIDFTERYITKINQENINTAGGFLVPEEFGTDLIDLKEQYGVARRLLATIPMSSDTKTEPRRTGGLTAYPVAEKAAGTESTATWDQVRLTAKDWMVLTRLTKQLDEDAAINVGDKLAYEIAYAFSLKEDQCAFNGDGGSTYGGITGFRSAINNVASNAGIQTQGTSNTWSALVLGDFDGVVGKLPQYADTPNACWVMHRTFYYSVVEKLIQASGGVPAYEVREGQRKPRPMFKGYPVEFSQVFPAATAVATIVCTLGDHALAGMFGDRSQDAIEFSKEATIGGESLWERNEIGVKGTERFDINIHDVGTATDAGPVVALKTGP